MFLKNKILSMCVLLAFIVQIVALGGLTGGIVYAGGAVFINESFNIPLGETLPAGWSLLTDNNTNNGTGSNTIVEKPFGD
ncbi:MAG: hypothetical protein M0R40_09150, partial [Firmicutes bacterium]|nr:hypothetical protein [Bacillota bacterium]